jgi:hypothetical protein
MGELMEKVRVRPDTVYSSLSIREYALEVVSHIVRQHPTIVGISNRFARVVWEDVG